MFGRKLDIAELIWIQWYFKSLCLINLNYLVHSKICAHWYYIQFFHCHLRYSQVQRARLMWRIIVHRWLCVSLHLPQCVSNGVTAVLHLVSDICFDCYNDSSDSDNPVFYNTALNAIYWKCMRQYCVTQTSNNYAKHSCFIVKACELAALWSLRSVKKFCDAFISYQSVPGEINTEQGDIPHVTSMMTSLNGNLFRLTGPLCGNSPVTGEFPSQRLVTLSFDVFFDLRLNKRFSKQSRRRWFETPSGPL